MWDQRDPRLMATVIAPYTTYLGWNRNEERLMTFIFAKNQKGDVVAVNENNGFMRNNKGGWETYFWRKFVPEGELLRTVNIHLSTFRSSVWRTFI